MKTFVNTGAQGEIYFERINFIPKGVKPFKIENGKYIVAHSETGHHHVMEAEGATFYEKVNQEGMTILYAILDTPNQLKHLRDHDTHETILFQPGIYEFSPGREVDHYADLYRKQMD